VLLAECPTGRIADVLRHDALYAHRKCWYRFFANHDVPRFAARRQHSAKLKLAFGLHHVARIPEIYYGDEIGMPGGGDPDNRRDFPGGWIGDAYDGFTQAGRTRDQQEMFSYVASVAQASPANTPPCAAGSCGIWPPTNFCTFLSRNRGGTRCRCVQQRRSLAGTSHPLADTPVQRAAANRAAAREARAELAKR